MKPWKYLLYLALCITGLFAVKKIYDNFDAKIQAIRAAEAVNIQPAVPVPQPVARPVPLPDKPPAPMPPVVNPVVKVAPKPKPPEPGHIYAPTCAARPTQTAYGNLRFADAAGVHRRPCLAPGRYELPYGTVTILPPRVKPRVR